MPSKVNVKEHLEGNTIDLSLSELHEVPVREIAALKKGTVLDLSNNRLVSLGKNFSSLTHLIELDLSKNLLKELPEDFGGLIALKRLDLYGNKLEHLPLSFSQLKALKWLDLKGNPLVPRLAEIAGPCEETKDCEDCARNVVEALSRTALEVEEERKRRLKEQLLEKEKEEQELLAKKKDLENAKKKNKNEKEKAKVNEKPAPPSPAKSVNETVVKETVVKDKVSKQSSAKEKPPKNIVQRVRKAPQQAQNSVTVKHHHQATQADCKTKKQTGSLCTRLILGCVWMFLFAMLAAVSVVTFALWERTLFEMAASKLGPQGGVVAEYVLHTITGLSNLSSDNIAHSSVKR